MRIIVLSFLALLSLNAFAETLKIGYIDINQVVSNLPQYQQNVDRLSNEFEPKKQELLDLFNHIELLRAKIIVINNSENLQNLIKKIIWKKFKLVN